VEEAAILKSQFVTSSWQPPDSTPDLSNRSQTVTGSQKHRDPRFLPWVFTEHGAPDVLTLADLDVPAPKENQVLLRVRAASLNPLDWHMVRGEPAFMKMMARGDKKVPGVDVSGEVITVGAKVTRFRPGDEVFGSAWRACAEYVCTGEKRLAPKPAQLTHEQAAAIPVAAYTSLHAMRHYGRVRPGQAVLINGASGGVGTMAVQIARALGAEVTAVCSTRNLDLVRSLGAHHAIDYTSEDFAAMDRRWDVVIQVAGNRTNDELRRALKPAGHLKPILRMRGRLGLDPQLTCWHDADELRRASGEADRLARAGHEDDALHQYRRVPRLYAGPYLEGCYMDWALILRSQIERSVVEALSWLTSHSVARERHAEAIEHGSRLLEIDPCHQQGCLHLMQAHLALGEAERAVRRFEACRRALRSELDLEPSTELLRALQLARLSLDAPPSVSTDARG